MQLVRRGVPITEHYRWANLNPLVYESVKPIPTVARRKIKWVRMTIASSILLLLMMPCAFIFGFSVSQGGTCAVTAAKQLVYERHGTLLTGFAIAVGASGLICLPLAWIFGNTVYLTRDAMISPEFIAGAALLGIGAVINDACLSVRYPGSALVK